MEHIKKTKPIKPQDLRIGNIVHLTDSDFYHFIEITAIEKYGCWGRWSDDDPDIPFAYDDIDGIQISDELLQRIGFERKTYFDEYFNKVQGCPTELKRLKIRYLHQLQNYIYTHCGEELNINLNKL